MDWNILGALGEIAGGAGVVVSLVYLGTQIRFSARATKSESTRAMARQIQELILLDDRLWLWIDLWLRGERQEAIRSNLENGFRLIFDVYESMWVAVRSGTVDGAYANRLYDRYLPYTLMANFGRDSWRSIRGTYDPEFVRFVDDFLEGLPPAQSDEEMIVWLNTIRKYRPDIFFEPATEVASA